MHITTHNTKQQQVVNQGVSWGGVLGIVTLINAAPVDLSLMHQGLGVVTLMAATRMVWSARSPQAKAAANNSLAKG